MTINLRGVTVDGVLHILFCVAVTSTVLTALVLAYVGAVLGPHNARAGWLWLSGGLLVLSATLTVALK